MSVQFMLNYGSYGSFTSSQDVLFCKIVNVKYMTNWELVYLFCRTASNIPITLEKKTTGSRFYSMWTLAGDEGLKIWKPARCKSVQLRHVSSLSVPQCFFTLAIVLQIEKQHLHGFGFSQECSRLILNPTVICMDCYHNGQIAVVVLVLYRRKEEGKTKTKGAFVQLIYGSFDGP